MGATVDVDEEESATMGAGATAEPDASSPQQRLKPVAQFLSFTIWRPDNSVVES